MCQRTTPLARLTNGYKIRRGAIDHNIPLMTNVRLAKAFIEAFTAMKLEDVKIKSLAGVQQLIARRETSMNSDEYRTIKSEGEGYYTEKRSKFLAFAHHVETVEQIKDLLAIYRKKYYDARHVCYAYMLGPERTEFRANDDGEPSSTNSASRS